MFNRKQPEQLPETVPTKLDDSSIDLLEKVFALMAKYSIDSIEYQGCKVEKSHHTIEIEKKSKDDLIGWAAD